MYKSHEGLLSSLSRGNFNSNGRKLEKVKRKVDKECPYSRKDLLKIHKSITCQQNIESQKEKLTLIVPTTF